MGEQREEFSRIAIPSPVALPQRLLAGKTNGIQSKRGCFHEKGEIRLENSQNWNSNFSSQPCQQPRELHLLPNPAWSQLANPTFLLHGQVPGLKIFPEVTLSLAASGKAGNCSGTSPGEEQSRVFSGIAGLWRAANSGFSLLLDHFN